ncbi:MAG: hypothetical protein ACR2QF_12280, partial [Geminicoccaceae bacterium]
MAQPVPKENAVAQERDDGARLDEVAELDDSQSLIYVADGSKMILPDSVSLLHAEFTRHGSDLLVGGADRPALVILDYFVVDQAPDLMTEGGAVLAGRVIEKLAGPDLQGSSDPAKTSDQEPIGHVEQLEGEVIITRADGTRVVATEGTPVFQDDVITTDGGSAVGPLASDAAAGGYDGTLTGSPSWQDATDLTTALNTPLAGRISASDLEGDSLTYSVATNAANGT